MKTTTQKAIGAGLVTVREFSSRHPLFTEPVLRGLLTKAQDRQTSQGMTPGNGLAAAIVRIGRRVYLDENLVKEWLAQKRQPAETGQ